MSRIATSVIKALADVVELTEAVRNTALIRTQHQQRLAKEVVDANFERLQRKLAYHGTLIDHLERAQDQRDQELEFRRKGREQTLQRKQARNLKTELA